MPEDQPLPEISQTLRLQLEASIAKAKPLQEFVLKLQKRLTKSERQLKKYEKLWKKTEKQLAKTRKVSDKLILSQKKMALKVKATSDRVTKQTKALRQQAAQMKQSTRAARGYTSGLVKLAAIAGGAFFGLQKLQQFVDNRFSVALNNGAAALQSIADSAGDGISSDRAFELVTKFQNQDLSSLALGLRDDVRQGLLDAQAELAKGIPIAKANEILLNLTKATDSPSRERELLAGAGTLEERILGNANIRNIRETIQALNALRLPPSESEGKEAQILKSAADVAASLESMNKAVSDITVNLATKLKPAIETISNLVAAHPTAAAIGTAGVVGATAVGLSGLTNLFLLNKVLGKGATAAVATKAAETGIPVIKGFAQRKIIAETAKITTARLLGQFAGRALLAPLQASEALAFALATNPAAVGATALSVAAPVALAGAGALAIYKSEETNRALEQQFQGQQDLQQRLGAISQKAREAKQSPDELTRLRGKRLEIDRHIIAADPDDRNLGRLRIMRKEVVAQIESLRASAEAIAETTTAIEESAKQTAETAKPAEAAAKSLDKTKESLKHLGETASNVVAPLLTQAEIMRDLQLTSSLEQSRTQLAQVERDIASVFHPLLGLNQQRALQDQRLAEIKSLEDILGVMEIRDDRDRIEANKLILTIGQLKLSNRQDSQKLLNAFEGQLGQIIGVGGRFSKLIISLQNQQAIGVGIEKGIANLHKTIPFLTGQVGPSKGLLPQSPAQVFGPGFFKIIDSLDVRKAKREIARLGKLTPPVIAPPPPKPKVTQAPATETGQQSLERPSPFSIIEDDERGQTIHSEAIREIENISQSTEVQDIREILSSTEREVQQTLETSQMITEIQRELERATTLQTSEQSSETSANEVREVLSQTNSEVRELSTRTSEAREIASIIKESQLQSTEIQRDIERDKSERIEALEVINNVNKETEHIETIKHLEGPPLPNVVLGQSPPYLGQSPPYLPSLPQIPLALKIPIGPPVEPKMISAQDVPRTKEQQVISSQKKDMQRKMPALRKSGGGEVGRATQKGAQMIVDGLSLIVKQGDIVDFLMSDNATTQDRPTESGRNLASA